jgi:quercetin dioxygenase-like cupin family protein
MAGADVVVGLGDGETISRREQRELVLLASQPELAVTWTRYAAGEPGPDPHVHREHTDAFYVLEGELTFTLGPALETTRVPAGGFVAVPPGVVHAFANDGPTPASYVNVHAPETGFAAYLRGLRDGTRVAFDQFDPPADGGRPAGEAIVTGPGEGERVVAGSARGVVKGASADLHVVEWSLDGAFDDPHDHDGRAVACYVLEGELDATVGGALHVAGTSALVCVPRGVPYTLANSGAGRARVVLVHAPG